METLREQMCVWLQSTFKLLFLWGELSFKTWECGARQVEFMVLLQCDADAPYKQ